MNSKRDPISRICLHLLAKFLERCEKTDIHLLTSSNVSAITHFFYTERIRKNFAPKTDEAIGISCASCAEMKLQPTLLSLKIIKDQAAFMLISY